VFGWRASGAESTLVSGMTPSHVSLEMLDWIGSDPFTCFVGNVGLDWLRPVFCLVGGMKYGMDDSFNSVNGSHMS
jgi:hypothetical protein